MLSKSLNPVIELGFSKTKYGSKRNNFVQQNKAFMNGLSVENAHLTDFSKITLYRPLIEIFSDEDFAKNYPLFMSEGEPIGAFKCERDDTYSPFGELILSHDVVVGETLHAVAMLSIQKGTVKSERLNKMSVELTREMIESLSSPNIIDFGGQSLIKLQGLCKPPTGYDLEGIAVAFFTTGGYSPTQSVLTWVDPEVRVPGGV